MIDLMKLSLTEDGRKTIASYARNLTNTKLAREEEVFWKYYNNEFPSDTFDYLKKYGDFVLPAEVRHIPKQRIYIDYLKGTQARRKFIFGVKAVDKTSMAEKREKLIDAILDALEEQYSMQQMQLEQQAKGIQEQHQQLVQFVSQEPQTQEQAQQIQQVKQTLPQIELQVKMMLFQINKKSERMNEVIDGVVKRKGTNEKTNYEDLMTKRSQRLISEFKIDETSMSNFISETVTGRQYYYVDYNANRDELVFEDIPAKDVFYLRAGNEKMTQDCELAGFRKRMKLSDLIREFNLTENQIRRILNSNNVDLDNTSFVGGPGNYAVYVGGSSTPFEIEGIVVDYIWWLADKKIKAIKIPNKHSKEYMHRILPDDANVINEEDYKYEGREWVNKEFPERRFFHNKVSTYNPNKGHIYEERYFTVRYRSIVINNDITITGMDEVQHWTSTDYQKNKLPIVGPAFSAPEYLPYSLIKATKGLQESYNLVKFHEELMMATSGTKTLLFDSIQRPTGMSKKEWMYQLKIGIAEIQTRKAGIVQPTFNQFQEVDMSLSSSIQFLGSIAERLDHEIGSTMGVTRQAIGQTVNADQVGTFKLSQQSTLLVTEILFTRHDMILREALSLLINLYAKFKSNQDEMFEDTDGVVQYIPQGMFAGRDYELQGHNNAEEESDLSMMKEMAMNFSAKGAFSLGEFSKLYTVTSVGEFQAEITEIETKAMEIRQQMVQQEGEATAKQEQEMKNLELQHKAASDKMKQETDMMKLKLDEQTMLQNASDKQKDREQKETENIRKTQLDAAKIANEQTMEGAVLNQNDKFGTVDRQISMLKLQLESMMNSLNISKEKKKNLQDFNVNWGKIGVEEKKVAKMNKEHVSDN